MSTARNKDKLKKLAAEFAKELKTSDGLSDFTRDLVKLTVEAEICLNRLGRDTLYRRGERDD